MLELGATSRYVLCDTDPLSTGDLGRWAARLGLTGRALSVTGDGMAAIAGEVLRARASASEPVGGEADRARASASEPVGGETYVPVAEPSTLVHIDPYDPNAREPGSLSALELTARLIDAGVGVVYRYGFDTPAERGWALRTRHQTTGAALWCGDVLVTAADGTVRDDGDLGRATTPGTGFGIVLANVGSATLDRCEAVGTALAHVYDGAPLPDGGSSRLDFRVEATTG